MTSVLDLELTHLRAMTASGKVAVDWPPERVEAVVRTIVRHDAPVPG